MYRHVVICFVCLYVLCQLDTNNTAVIQKSATNWKKTQVTVLTRNNLSKNSTFLVATRKGTSENSKIFITTRTADDDTVTMQACQCIVFYGCTVDNFFEVPDNPKACSVMEVCCKIETPLDINTDTDLIDSQTRDDNATPASESNFETTVTSSDGICECVSPSKCRRTLEEEKDGTGILTPKNAFSCDEQQICCPPRNIKSIPGEDEVKDTSIKCGESRAIVDIRIQAPRSLSSTVFGEFPWMASIWKTSDSSVEDIFVCGASILATNIVLTAAHCVHKLDVASLKVRVGDYDIRADVVEEKFPHQVLSVSAVSIHPNFNSEVLFNDLALVISSESFTFDYHISPVCTSVFDSKFASSEIYNSSNCIATGWGKSGSEPEAPLTSSLKKVHLTLIPSDQCQEKLRTTRLKEYFTLESSFLCAGGEKGFDTCVGDGGGPLVCPLNNNGNQYVQVGVTSWGVGCGNDIPGVYASLEANAAWLSSEFDKYKISSPITESRNAKSSRKTSH